MSDSYDIDSYEIEDEIGDAQIHEEDGINKEEANHLNESPPPIGYDSLDLDNSDDLNKII